MTEQLWQEVLQRLAHEPGTLLSTHCVSCWYEVQTIPFPAQGFLQPVLRTRCLHTEALPCARCGTHYAGRGDITVMTHIKSVYILCVWAWREQASPLHFQQESTGFDIM